MVGNGPGVRCGRWAFADFASLREIVLVGSAFHLRALAERGWLRFFRSVRGQAAPDHKGFASFFRATSQADSAAPGCRLLIKKNENAPLWNQSVSRPVSVRTWAHGARPFSYSWGKAAGHKMILFFRSVTRGQAAADRILEVSQTQMVRNGPGVRCGRWASADFASLREIVLAGSACHLRALAGRGWLCFFKSRQTQAESRGPQRLGLFFQVRHPQAGRCATPRCAQPAPGPVHQRVRIPQLSYGTGVRGLIRYPSNPFSCPLWRSRHGPFAGGPRLYFPRPQRFTISFRCATARPAPK
jgi:hypothetical protein